VMRNIFIRLMGWRAAIFHGDPTVYDRWKWLRRYLSHGALRTLDVGCGSGAFTMYAAKIGNESVGLSFNDSNSQAVRGAQVF
jgi:ribosomal protein L11 methylase PrmA